MDSNNIVTAPQALNVQELYKIWTGSHFGSLTDFYKFLTTPSVERDSFISSIGGYNNSFDNSVLSVIIKNIGQ